MLATLQDEVIEFVAKTGWPPSDPAHSEAAQRAVDLPEPNAEVRDGELHCWFGSQQEPALTVPPVQL